MRINRLLREPERRQVTGVATSTWYDLLNRGLALPPVRLSKYSVAWPESELAALNAARIAGYDDDRIRALVKKLVAARANALDETAVA